MLARVVLLPREVVMVVDLVELARAEDPDHAVADPVATCVRVTTGEGHRGDVLRAEGRIRVQDKRSDVHAVSCAAFLERPRGDAVAEPAASEMGADPDAVLLVGEDVDVVVARADGAELGGRLVAQLQVLDRRPGRVVEQLVVDALRVLAADAEADRGHDVVHDPVDAGARVGA